MIRQLYGLAWWLALPFVLLRLWRRGNTEPGYRRHVAERLGFYSRREDRPPLVWLHAVSVGETRAAQPLIEALLERYPGHGLLLTHMTPTGRATGEALFARYGARFVQAYLPYDTGWMVRRFLRHFSPRLGILMETEVWPNLVQESVRAGLPMALVNARLSERSLRKGQRVAALMEPAAAVLSCVAAQTPADADRLRQFGATAVHVTGSIKFDVAPPEAMLALGKRWKDVLNHRSVFLCASTREGEERLILDAWAACRWEGLRPLLMIVPRHPQRFAEVEHLMRETGLTVTRRSSWDAPGVGMALETADAVLGDSMGELFAYYAACDAAFIGGSLLPLGGQNLIEACAVGRPVLIGPHTFNFLSISEDAVAAGAALRVGSAQELVQQAMQLLQDPPRCQAMADAAFHFARQHRGATKRTVRLLAPFIDR